MSKYCYVQSDLVVIGPTDLPATWTDPVTGAQYSNLGALTNPQLLTLGWYPYVENDPGSPGDYYDRVIGPFQINPTNVTRDVTYQQWDVDRIKISKDTELKAQLTQYTTNEQAINPKINDYVNNDAKWLADEQAKLARLTDWNAVADFDTAKPVVLALPNSYVGESYVRQGVALTAQNNAAVDSGLSALWDQATVNSFVAANQTAADDSSDSIAPTKPSFRIRQGIANVSEQFNRIIIWRFDVEGETDPNLDRSMAMQMSNRQDNRDLYVFIYTNAGSTYLSWKKFEDQGNGIWKWYLDKDVGDGSTMTWVDSDIAFIMSYGTNPALEADYFTDQIQFPAGVEQQNLLVAWDPV